MPPHLPPSLIAAAVIYVLAYGVGILAFVLMARRRGLATPGVRAVAVAGLIGGLVGANAAQFAFTGLLGKTVLGGVVGGYLTVVLFKRWIGLQRPLGDLFAVALCAGEVVGRWGCFVGGCCYGKAVAGVSVLPWAVYQHDAWRHPAQAYLSLASLLILAVLLVCEWRRILPENGLFFLQGALYSIARFVIEFFREGAPFALGLTLAQWACVAGLIFFGYRFWRLTAQNAPSRRRAALHPAAGAALRP